MKAQTKTKPRKPVAKHQRLKLAFIPVLLLVLAYVLFAPADQTESASEPIAAIADRMPVAAASGTTQPAVDAVAQANKPTWPEANLQFLTSSNPFRSIAVETADRAGQRFLTAKVQPSIDDVDYLATLASELERRQVNFVFRSNKQNIIMLGDEILEEGTHLSPTVQLDEIDEHALLLRLHP